MPPSIAVPALMSALDSAILWLPTAGGLLATYTLIGSRKLPGVVLRIWFTASLLFCCAGLGLVAIFWRFLKLVGLLPVARFRTRLAQSFALLMHLHRAMNPQVTVRRASGSIPWESITESHLLMANHQSFQDLFGGLWIVPLSYMNIMRIFYKGSLRSTPIIGKLFEEAGMFPVHYTSTKYDDFSVAKDQQAEVMRNVDAFLSDGGSLMLAPEGVVNKSPRQLTDFRLGSFNLAIKHKLPIYYILYVGHSDVWPAGWPIGGNPADVMYYIAKFPVDYREGSDDNNAQDLARRLREEMQTQLNRVYAERDTISGQMSKKKA